MDVKRTGFSVVRREEKRRAFFLTGQSSLAEIGMLRRMGDERRWLIDWCYR